MASGQKTSQAQQSPTDADLTINEDEFDIHVVAYRSFQQIFGPGGLAKLEKILESEEEVHAPLMKRLIRKPSGRIVSAQAPTSSEVKSKEVPWWAGITNQPRRLLRTSCLKFLLVRLVWVILVPKSLHLQGHLGPSSLLSLMDLAGE